MEEEECRRSFCGGLGGVEEGLSLLLPLTLLPLGEAPVGFGWLVVVEREREKKRRGKKVQVSATTTTTTTTKSSRDARRA
jgi:hypothetical protein